jgi:esterase
LSSYQTSERFDGKTLFIRGEKSQYVKDDYLVTIDQYFSNYQLETVSGAGHWLHAENPKEFLDLSLKFLLQ